MTAAQMLRRRLAAETLRRSYKQQLQRRRGIAAQRQTLRSCGAAAAADNEGVEGTQSSKAQNK